MQFWLCFTREYTFGIVTELMVLHVVVNDSLPNNLLIYLAQDIIICWIDDPTHQLMFPKGNNFDHVYDVMKNNDYEIKDIFLLLNTERQSHARKKIWQEMYKARGNQKELPIFEFEALGIQELASTVCGLWPKKNFNLDPEANGDVFVGSDEEDSIDEGDVDFIGFPFKNQLRKTRPFATAFLFKNNETALTCYSSIMDYGTKNTALIFDWCINQSDQSQSAVKKIQKNKIHLIDGSITKASFSVTKNAPDVVLLPFTSPIPRPFATYDGSVTPVKGDTVLSIGHPGGVPLKATIGEYLHEDGNFHYVNLDVFPGLNGSPVWILKNSCYKLIGFVSSGIADDYQTSWSKSCPVKLVVVMKITALNIFKDPAWTF